MSHSLTNGPRAPGSVTATAESGDLARSRFKCVGYQIDLQDTAAGIDGNRDGIEPAGAIHEPARSQVVDGQPLQAVLLERGNGLKRTAIVGRGPRLHLQEDKGTVVLGHQVELSHGAPHVAVTDEIPAAAQRANGSLFDDLPEVLHTHHALIL